MGKPNINVNLSVLSPPKHCISRTPTPTSTASLKNESVSTPKSMQSDNNDHQRTHPRPTRPPITRLQPKKDNNNNNMAPTCNPSLSSSQSAENNFIDKNHKIQNQKPPLLGQRSAPSLLATTTSNKEKIKSTQTITENNEAPTNINNNGTNTNQSNQ